MIKSLALALVVATCCVACSVYQPPALPSTPSSTAAATPGAQSRIVLVASSRADQQLDISAQVLDAKGLGIPGIAVAFTIVGGIVTPQTVTTDASGNAKAIGIASGNTTLSATTGALTQAVTGATPLSVTLAVPSIVVNNPSQFTATVVGAPLGGPFTYVWTYGDGTGDTGTTNTIAHAYRIGSFNATVKVTDGAGRSATGSATAVVTDVPAVVTPTPTPAATKVLSITLTCTAAAHATPSVCNVAATYGSDNIASNKISSVTWDWGDGTNPLQVVANSPLASHTYLQAGVYLISGTVTAVTSDGSKTADAVTKSITVS